MITKMQNIPSHEKTIRMLFCSPTEYNDLKYDCDECSYTIPETDEVLNDKNEYVSVAELKVGDKIRFEFTKKLSDTSAVQKGCNEDGSPIYVLDKNTPTYKKEYIDEEIIYIQHIGKNYIIDTHDVYQDEYRYGNEYEDDVNNI